MAEGLDTQRAAGCEAKPEKQPLFWPISCIARSIGLFTSIFGRSSEAAVDSPEKPDPIPTEEPDVHAPTPALKLPDDLMRELFPKGGTMVSVVFEPAKAAAEPPPLPPPADEPLAEDSPDTLGKHPDLLKLPDALRHALFPEQKQMLSVVFTPPSPAPATPLKSPDANERAKRWAFEDLGGPIV